MEGRLIPGRHYVELRPDYEDLDETIALDEQHLMASITQQGHLIPVRFSFRRTMLTVTT